ncbi:hypothetical protein [Amycolatopsis suaedae]|uniref:Uncharacterized protein n=1 Tax=Amycolatopsis suaedae TaxID=2510978 RepID=A0A4Q7J2A4_9PSEU|nr:hypothetical protein [Amycolatopsis suaedae]RZQ60656.1 hypothetical protein EWH70_28775 [Amycolatopsis suaedae]
MKPSIVRPILFTLSGGALSALFILGAAQQAQAAPIPVNHGPGAGSGQSKAPFRPPATVAKKITSTMQKAGSATASKPKPSALGRSGLTTTGSTLGARPASLGRTAASPFTATGLATGIKRSLGTPNRSTAARPNRNDQAKRPPATSPARRSTTPLTTPSSGVKRTIKPPTSSQNRYRASAGEAKRPGSVMSGRAASGRDDALRATAGKTDSRRTTELPKPTPHSRTNNPSHTIPGLAAAGRNDTPRTTAGKTNRNTTDTPKSKPGRNTASTPKSKPSRATAGVIPGVGEALRQPGKRPAVEPRRGHTAKPPAAPTRQRAATTSRVRSTSGTGQSNRRIGYGRWCNTGCEYALDYLRPRVPGMRSKGPNAGIEATGPDGKGSLGSVKAHAYLWDVEFLEPKINAQGRPPKVIGSSTFGANAEADASVSLQNGLQVSGNGFAGLRAGTPVEYANGPFKVSGDVETTVGVNAEGGITLNPLKGEYGAEAELRAGAAVSLPKGTAEDGPMSAGIQPEVWIGPGVSWSAGVERGEDGKRRVTTKSGFSGPAGGSLNVEKSFEPLKDILWR